MNILFLEDRASATEQIENYLRIIMKNNVFSACNIYEANSIMKNNKIDCFVVDLNLPPNGNTKKRMGSLLFSGWIWIIDVVIKDLAQAFDKNEKFPIIIYSEFIREFEKQYEDFHEKNEEDWMYYDKVEKIKKFEENTSQNLLNAIESVNSQLRKQL